MRERNYSSDEICHVLLNCSDLRSGGGALTSQFRSVYPRLRVGHLLWLVCTEILVIVTGSLLHLRKLTDLQLTKISFSGTLDILHLDSVKILSRHSVVALPNWSVYSLKIQATGVCIFIKWWLQSLDQSLSNESWSYPPIFAPFFHSGYFER